jgi:hypothetical protein
MAPTIATPSNVRLLEIWAEPSFTLVRNVCSGLRIEGAERIRAPLHAIAIRERYLFFIIICIVDLRDGRSGFLYHVAVLIHFLCRGGKAETCGKPKCEKPYGAPLHNVVH